MDILWIGFKRSIRSDSKIRMFLSLLTMPGQSRIPGTQHGCASLSYTSSVNTQPRIDLQTVVKQIFNPTHGFGMPPQVRQRCERKAVKIFVAAVQCRLRDPFGFQQRSESIIDIVSGNDLRRTVKNSWPWSYNDSSFSCMINIVTFGQ